MNSDDNKNIQNVNQVPVQPMNNYNQSNMQNNQVPIQPVNNYNQGNMQNNQVPIQPVNNYNQGNMQNNQVPVQPVNNYYQNSNNKKNSNGGLKVLLIIVFVVVVGFVSLNLLSKTKTSNSHTDYERTIMLYMVGADLESGNLGLATTDLEGIDYNKLEEQNTKLVVIAGGTKRWHNNYINVDETSIYELTSEGFKVVKKQEKQNMGSPEVFSNFLDYAYNNYKSKKYDLVLWNHGSGVIGSEHDENTGDFLTLTEINSALNNSVFSEKNKLEIVFFRTCLNGTIEVADTLKKYSQYMVASEEVTNGYIGNSFLKIFNEFKKSDDGKQVGIKIADAYKDYIKALENLTYSTYGSIYYTYSVVDLSKIDDLEKSVNDFFSSINVSTNYNVISRVRANLLQYGSIEPIYDSVDLYKLIDNLKSLNSSGANKFFDNYSKTVVYNISSDKRSNGLSVYFPYNGDSESRSAILNKFYNFNDLSGYKSFITTFNTVRSNSSYKSNFLGNNINLNKENNDSDFNLVLTDEQVKNYSRAGYIVFRDNKDGTYLPVYSGKNVTLDGNNLKANIKDRQLKVIDKGDNSNGIITLIETNETDDSIYYKTNVILENFEDKDPKNWLMVNAEMSLIFNKSDNSIKIGSILASNKNNNDKSEEKSESLAKLPYVSVVNLDDYTHIVFGSSSYKILDSNGNYVEKWDSNGVFKGQEIKPSNLEFKLQDYNDGYDYYAVFGIRDVNNNLSYSKLVKMK